MATFKNPANENRDVSLLAAGVIGWDRYEFNLAASYATGCGADESLIVIGYVPADCVLIPHLSRLYIPQLDAHVSPTGDHEVGILTNTDALLASIASETAATTYFGEDFLVPAEVIGSATAPTPIVIRVVNVIATLGTGTIRFEPAYRARRSVIDG